MIVVVTVEIWVEQRGGRALWRGRMIEPHAKVVPCRWFACHSVILNCKRGSDANPPNLVEEAAATGVPLSSAGSRRQIGRFQSIPRLIGVLRIAICEVCDRGPERRAFRTLWAGKVGGRAW
jgi:hypothetical protein